MTRINCIPVQDLSNQHLIAEYRELPRVFNYARADAKIPAQYTLGKGHMTFFFDKLIYLHHRQVQLIYECLERGFDIQFTKPVSLDRFPAILLNDWQPTNRDLALNRTRIIMRKTQSTLKQLKKR